MNKAIKENKYDEISKLYKDGYSIEKLTNILCATFKFCKGLSSFLYNKLNIYSSIYDTNNEITKTINIFKKEQIYKFLDYLYNGSVLYIERKYNDYLRIAKEMNESLIA